MRDDGIVLEDVNLSLKTMASYEEEPIIVRCEVALDLTKEQKIYMSLQEKFVCALEI